MKGIKENKGITLIALVMTIIVLLILAGIGIASLTGENGILKKANMAKFKTEKATTEEQVNLAVIASYDKDGELEIEELKKELEKIEGKVTITDSKEEFPVTVVVNEKIFEIDKKGNVTIKDGNQEGNLSSGIMAEDIVKNENKSEYYGSIVRGYECPNSDGVNNWKIFYVDESNIYLIADNYIHYDYCPSSTTQKINKEIDNDYSLSMNEVIKDYPNGSAHITNEKIKKLNDDYFNNKGYVSTNNNMKAVAYMLDTDVWSVYKGDKAEYAIGGPTVEMLMKSYSQKYKVDYRAQATDNIGYKISDNGGVNWEIYKNTIFNSTDSLYVKDYAQYITGMWMASPSASYYKSLNVLDYGGGLNVGYYSNSQGFRPIVCLSSEVELEKVEENIFRIK